MKQCRDCGESKPETEFHKNRTKSDGLANECKECRCLASRLRFERDPEHVRRLAREWKARRSAALRRSCRQCGVEFCPTRQNRQLCSEECRKARYKTLLAEGRFPSRAADIQKGRMLKRHYGMTLAEYEALFALQGGLCAICGKSSKRGLVVDHDHTDGHVRGLLCSNCNMGIGYLREDEENFRAAVDYLRRDRAQRTGVA